MKNKLPHLLITTSLLSASLAEAGKDPNCKNLTEWIQKDSNLQEKKKEWDALSSFKERMKQIIDNMDEGDKKGSLGKIETSEITVLDFMNNFAQAIDSTVIDLDQQKILSNLLFIVHEKGGDATSDFFYNFFSDFEKNGKIISDALISELESSVTANFVDIPDDVSEPYSWSDFKEEGDTRLRQFRETLFEIPKENPQAQQQNQISENPQAQQQNQISILENENNYLPDDLPFDYLAEVLGDREPDINQYINQPAVDQNINQPAVDQNINQPLDNDSVQLPNAEVLPVLPEVPSFENKATVDLNDLKEFLLHYGKDFEKESIENLFTDIEEIFQNISSNIEKEDMKKNINSLYINIMQDSVMNFLEKEIKKTTFSDMKNFYGVSLLPAEEIEEVSSLFEKIVAADLTDRCSSYASLEMRRKKGLIETILMDLEKKEKKNPSSGDQNHEKEVDSLLSAGILQLESAEAEKVRNLVLSKAIGFKELQEEVVKSFIKPGINLAQNFFRTQQNRKNPPQEKAQMQSFSKDRQKLQQEQLYQIFKIYFDQDQEKRNAFEASVSKAMGLDIPLKKNQLPVTHHEEMAARLKEGLEGIRKKQLQKKEENL